MQRIAFAGPSVFGLDYRDWPGIDFLPPARRGDLVRVADAGAEIIVLIDGFFSDGPTVGHKEILYAIDKGAVILGAASLGALRAVECQNFGMIGVGRIFCDYQTRRRHADSDVAVLHAPMHLSWQPLTLALVDVEYAIFKLIEGSQISKQEAREIVAVARALHFSERYPKSLQTAGSRVGVDQSTIAAIISTCSPGQKQADARLVLDIATNTTSGTTTDSAQSKFVLSRTVFYELGNENR